MTKTKGVQTALIPPDQISVSSLMNLDGLKIHETTHLPQPNVGEADVGKDGGDDALSSTKEDEPKNNKDVDNVKILSKTRLEEQKCRSVIGKFIRDRRVNKRQFWVLQDVKQDYRFLQQYLFLSTNSHLSLRSLHASAQHEYHLFYPLDTRRT